MLMRVGTLLALIVGLSTMMAAPVWAQTAAERIQAANTLNIVFGASAQGVDNSRVSVSGAQAQANSLATQFNNASPGVQLAMAEALANSAATNPDLVATIALVLANNPGLSATFGAALATQNNPTLTAQVIAATTSAGGSTTALTATIQASNPTLLAAAQSLINSGAVQTPLSSGLALAITFVVPVNNTQTAVNVSQ
jgi:hypothetical protein